MHKFPQNTSPTPAANTWRYGTYGDGEGKTVELVCPHGHVSTLWSQRPGQPASVHHVIDADGFISPSLVCPRDNCHFADFGRLLNWKGLPSA